MRKTLLLITMAALGGTLAPRRAAAEATPVTRAGFLTDARGLPMTGNVLLDFTVADPADRREMWRESVYVSAHEGVFRADLGKVHPFPAGARISGDMVVVSVPAGTGWSVRPLQAPPAELPAEAAPPAAPAAPVARPEPEPPAPAPAPAVPASRAAVPEPERPAPPPPPARPRVSPKRPVAEAAKPAPAQRPPDEDPAEVQRLKRELEKAKADLEAQKTAVRPSVYEVQPGDTLRSIAEKIFGNPEQWIDIYQANDDRLLRGGDLVPGQKLIIPRDVPGMKKTNE